MIRKIYDLIITNNNYNYKENGKYSFQDYEQRHYDNLDFLYANNLHEIYKN